MWCGWVYCGFNKISKGGLATVFCLCQGFIFSLILFCVFVEDVCGCVGACVCVRVCMAQSILSVVLSHFENNKLAVIVRRKWM